MGRAEGRRRRGRWISVEGNGVLTVEGKLSSDAALTHMDRSPNTIQEPLPQMLLYYRWEKLSSDPLCQFYTYYSYLSPTVP